MVCRAHRRLFDVASTPHVVRTSVVASFASPRKRTRTYFHGMEEVLEVEEAPAHGDGTVMNGAAATSVCPAVKKALFGLLAFAITFGIFPLPGHFTFVLMNL